MNVKTTKLQKICYIRKEKRKLWLYFNLNFLFLCFIQYNDMNFQALSLLFRASPRRTT